MTMYVFRFRVCTRGGDVHPPSMGGCICTYWGTDLCLLDPQDLSEALTAGMGRANSKRSLGLIILFSYIFKGLFAV